MTDLIARNLTFSKIVNFSPIYSISAKSLPLLARSQPSYESLNSIIVSCSCCSKQKQDLVCGISIDDKRNFTHAATRSGKYATTGNNLGTDLPYFDAFTCVNGLIFPIFYTCSQKIQISYS